MSKTVTVFGDVMLDTWLRCNPVKVSPEAPVLVCKRSGTMYSPGGAGNVAANLKMGFNVNVRLVGLQGTDEAHRHLLAALDVYGIPSKYLAGMVGWQTIEKCRIIDDLGRQMLRLDTELQSPEVPDHVQRNMNAHLHVGSQETDGLVISDYGKGTCTPALIRCAIQEFRDRGKYVIVNGKPERLMSYRGANLLVYNLAEAKEAWYRFGTGAEIEDTRSLASALWHALNSGSHDATELLITCGDKGMLHWDGVNAREAEAIAVPVADVCGAGDTVVATIAATGYCNLNVLREAAVNAAEVVSQHGTSICARKEEMWG
jgi:D-beta-D-heptose 7-phosphate kinase/D-beta-D-heptose 1-phosphate adenosyltransferase